MILEVENECPKEGEKSADTGQNLVPQYCTNRTGCQVINSRFSAVSLPFGIRGACRFLLPECRYFAIGRDNYLGCGRFFPLDSFYFLAQIIDLLLHGPYGPDVIADPQ